MMASCSNGWTRWVSTVGNCRLLLVSGPKVLDGDCSDCKIPPGGKVGRSLVADGSLGDSSGCWDARHLLNRTGDVLEETYKGALLYRKSIEI